MKEKSPNLVPYFEIHHGEQNWLFDMPEVVRHTVFQMEASGDAISQFPLPKEVSGREDGDRLVWMPAKVAAKVVWQQERIGEYTEKIKTKKPKL